MQYSIVRERKEAILNCRVFVVYLATLLFCAEVLGLDLRMCSFLTENCLCACSEGHAADVRHVDDVEWS